MTDSEKFSHRQRPGRIFISGGEISGDRQAAHLARHILMQNGDVQLYGCGGDHMRAAGVDVRLQTAQLGYIGLQESFRFRRPMRHAHQTLCKLLKDERPDLAILVDGEHFNLFLTSHLHREGIPFIYYFVPQVWFWGRWRTRGIARKALRVIPAFQAESEIFRRKGARVSWLGHPLLDIAQPGPDPRQSFLEIGLDPARPTVALLPGSRWQEVENFGPTLMAAAAQLLQRKAELQFILPVAAPHLHSTLVRQIEQAGLAGKVRLVSENVYSCLSLCEVALLSSGTATLETALLGVPMVAFYRVTPLTCFIARRLVTSRFIAMPNILLNEAVVPELIQSQFTVERLVAEASRVLYDREHALAVRRKLAQIPALLGRPGVLERAAHLVLRDAALQPAPAVPALCAPALA
jgi:lipid-A-disaccharide synthase